MITIKNEEERIEEVNAVKIGQVLTGRKCPQAMEIITKLRRKSHEQRNRRDD